MSKENTEVQCREEIQMTNKTQKKMLDLPMTKEVKDNKEI